MMAAIIINAQRIRTIDKDGQPVPYVSVMTPDAKFIGITDLAPATTRKKKTAVPFIPSCYSRCSPPIVHT